jgi:hypothetical protein
MRRVIVVERPLELDGAKLAQLERCTAVREVTLVHLLRGTDRELAVYEANDTEAVRDSYHSANVAFSSAWRAELHSNS